MKRFVRFSFVFDIIIHEFSEGIGGNVTLIRCLYAFLAQSFPSSYPALPQEVLSSAEIVGHMRDLTDLANVSPYYSFNI